MESIKAVGAGVGADIFIYLLFNFLYIYFINCWEAYVGLIDSEIQFYLSTVRFIY